MVLVKFDKGERGNDLVGGDVISRKFRLNLNNLSTHLNIKPIDIPGIEEQADVRVDIQGITWSLIQL